MDNFGKRLISDYIVILNFQTEYKHLCMNNDPDYSSFNQMMYDKYTELVNEYINILSDNKDLNVADVVYLLHSIDLTAEMKQKFMDLKEDALYKRAVGEYALATSEELCTLLETDLFKVSLENFEENFRKLQEMHTNETINRVQYANYLGKLNDIYSYHKSISDGEQLRFTKITNSQKKFIEQEAFSIGYESMDEFYNSVSPETFSEILSDTTQARSA